MTEEKILRRGGKGAGCFLPAEALLIALKQQLMFELDFTYSVDEGCG